MSMPSAEPGPTFSASALLGEPGDERIRGGADRDDRRDRHAALARRPVAGAHQRVGGEVEIGIGHDHGVVLRAAERLHALAAGGGRRVDVLARSASSRRTTRP